MMKTKSCLMAVILAVVFMTYFAVEAVEAKTYSGHLSAPGDLDSFTIDTGVSSLTYVTFLINYSELGLKIDIYDADTNKRLGTFNPENDGIAVLIKGEGRYRLDVISKRGSGEWSAYVDYCTNDVPVGDEYYPPGSSTDPTTTDIGEEKTTIDMSRDDYTPDSSTTPPSTHTPTSPPEGSWSSVTDNMHKGYVSGPGRDKGSGACGLTGGVTIYFTSGFNLTAEVTKIELGSRIMVIEPFQVTNAPITLPAGGDDYCIRFYSTSGAGNWSFYWK